MIEPRTDDEPIITWTTDAIYHPVNYEENIWNVLKEIRKILEDIDKKLNRAWGFDEKKRKN